MYVGAVMYGVFAMYDMYVMLWYVLLCCVYMHMCV